MSDSISLEGKFAVITGAAGDIGSATTSLMVARGAKVLAVDLPGTDFGPLQALGDKVTTCEADVTRETDVKGYVEQAKTAFGRIDIFFNNAGIEGPGVLIPDYTLEDFRKVLAVNLEGVFLGLKYVLPVMLAKGSGSVINASSLAGLTGLVESAGYCASKHAVLGLTRVAALEVAAKGVRVNCTNPGPIEGRMMDAINKGRGVQEEANAKTVPAGRYGRPDEVAALVAFLASDAAPFINGSFISMDGSISAA